MDRKTMKIDEDVHSKHNEKRKELGLPWTEYMRRLEYSPGYEENDELMNRIDDLETEMKAQFEGLR